VPAPHECFFFHAIFILGGTFRLCIQRRPPTASFFFGGEVGGHAVAITIRREASPVKVIGREMVRLYRWYYLVYIVHCQFLLSSPQKVEVMIGREAGLLAQSPLLFLLLRGVYTHL
jgi:hypothetical protein